MADTDNAAKMTPLRAGNLKKGSHIQIKGRPCKIVELSTSKTGKHGHAKINITAIDVITGKKLEDMTPSSHNISVPIVTKTEYQVIGIDDGFVQMMDDDGNQIEDVKIPEGTVGSDLTAAFENGESDVLCMVLQAPVGGENSAEWVRMIISSKTVN